MQKPVKKGATQQEIADAVGKSIGWVNRLLKWHDSGYKTDTAFGPDYEVKRKRAAAKAAAKLQAAIEREEEDKRLRAAQTADMAAGVNAQIEAAQARREAAAELAADVEAIMASKSELEIEELVLGEQSKQSKPPATVVSFPASAEKSDQLGDLRDHLVRALEALTAKSASKEERSKALKTVMKIQAGVGMSWDDVIVRSEELRSAA